MMYRPHTDGDGIALEQEFEWVNAWAAATRNPSTPPDASAAIGHAPSARTEKPHGDKPHGAKPLNGKARADVAAALPAAARAGRQAPAAVDAAKLHVRPIELVSALDPDPAVTPAGDTAAPEQSAVGQSDPGFIRIDDVEPLDSLTDAAGQGGKNGHRRGRWTDLFRLVTRTHGLPHDDRADADAARDLFVLDAAASLDDASASAVPGIAAAKAAALPHGDTAGPDQLARDIAEIELVRDKLLAVAPAHHAATGAMAGVRTSDAVPILVGVVLALTSMVVFAVAASFVSLR